MRLACRNTLFCVRECGGGGATLAAKFILAEAGTRLCAQNAIPLIACTVGSHASAPRNDQEQKHGGLAIVKTGVVPTTLTINQQNKGYQTALMLAIEYHKPRMFNRLLETKGQSTSLQNIFGALLNKSELVTNSFLEERLLRDADAIRNS